MVACGNSYSLTLRQLLVSSDRTRLLSFTASIRLGSGGGDGSGAVCHIEMLGGTRAE